MFLTLLTPAVLALIVTLCAGTVALALRWLRADVAEDQRARAFVWAIRESAIDWTVTR